MVVATFASHHKQTNFLVNIGWFLFDGNFQMGGEFSKISSAKLNSAVRNFRKHCLFPQISLVKYFQWECWQLTKISRYTVASKLCSKKIMTTIYPPYIKLVVSSVVGVMFDIQDTLLEGTIIGHLNRDALPT